jgi:hypothetical protein
VKMLMLDHDVSEPPEVRGEAPTGEQGQYRSTWCAVDVNRKQIRNGARRSLTSEETEFEYGNLARSVDPVFCEVVAQRSLTDPH